MILNIRGMSISGNLLMGVNRFGHCLTSQITGCKRRVAAFVVRVDLPFYALNILFINSAHIIKVKYP